MGKRSRSIKATKMVLAELENGKEVEWEFSATLTHDPNYGADADGNRGISMTEIDDIYPLGNIEKELKKDIYGNPLTDEEIVEAISALESKAEDADYDFCEDEPEYEYD